MTAGSPTSRAHGLSDEFLIELGDVMVSFALLEHEMRNLAAKLIGVDDGITSIVTNQLTFADLRDSLGSLWRERGELRVSEMALKELLKRAEAVEAERNRIVHSIWALSEKTGNPVRIKVRVRKKGRDVQVEDYDAERLRGFAQSLQLLAYDFSQFDPGPLWEVILLPYPRLNRVSDWKPVPE